ncbi:MAG: hypothetical protein AB8G86_26950 [Saprospiraceae bacterium]
MDKWKLFNLIAGMASIISLIITFITLKKVEKIENRIKINESVGDVKQKAKGKKNQQAGRDIKNKNRENDKKN